MDFKLNFLGLTIANFELAHHFYTAVLGLEARYSRPDWTIFATTGMTFALFNGGMPSPPARLWGRGQTIRPVLQIADLERTVFNLRCKGIDFVGAIEQQAWGERIEFIAPEGIGWRLAHAPAYPFGSSLRRPHLGWVEMKVHDLVGQRAFYIDVMGLQPEEDCGQQVILHQAPGEPLLFLEPGGHPLPAIQNRRQACHFIGFETTNIEQSAAYIKKHSVSIVQDVARHDWVGIDMFIKDVDGNLVQIVQYAVTG